MKVTHPHPDSFLSPQENLGLLRFGSEGMGHIEKKRELVFVVFGYIGVEDNVRRYRASNSKSRRSIFYVKLLSNPRMTGEK